MLSDDDDRAYRVDSQTGLHFEAPTPAEGEWVGAADPPVSVAFAKNDDTPADTVSFQCDLGGGLGGCASPLGESGFATDGTYAVTVKATDDAVPTANTAQVTRTFHVDRTAPGVTVTRPAEGSAQPKSFTPEHSVDEANPADAGAVTCKLDGQAYKAFRSYTTFRRLVVTGVPGGAKVTVTCKGKKCPARSFTRAGGGNVKLARFLKKKLRAGTKLTIRVIRPGSVGKQFVLRIRKGKRVRVTISQIA